LLFSMINWCNMVHFRILDSVLALTMLFDLLLMLYSISILFFRLTILYLLVKRLIMQAMAFVANHRYACWLNNKISKLSKSFMMILLMIHCGIIVIDIWFFHIWISHMFDKFLFYYLLNIKSLQLKLFSL
jgi:hypothetical protein